MIELDVEHAIPIALMNSHAMHMLCICSSQIILIDCRQLFAAIPNRLQDLRNARLR